jgi:rubrerythrin/ferredoxin
MSSAHASGRLSRVPDARPDAQNVSALKKDQQTMANITFRSPVMAKDLTIYAVAGARGSILKLAQEHKIPIPFDCGDGECGSCQIKVTHLGNVEKMGITLQEKEKEVLRQLGLITAEDIRRAETDDIPPLHRLACQFIVRNEDILVEFEGDETLPKKRPAMSIAAGSFTGGLRMTSVEMFLAYAMKVEEDAAGHFDELGGAMEACGNTEVGALFRQLAGYSRLHWEETKARAASMDVAGHIPDDTMWPALETPEQTSLWAGDAEMSWRDALKAALEGERKGFEFYHHVARTAANADIRALAKSFADEEAEHVQILERWIAGEEALLSA